MPYIKPEIRHILDNNIAALVDDIRAAETDCPKRDGICNYVITRLVLGAMRPNEGWSYHTLSNAIKVFQDAHDECKRKLLNAYEEKAIETNGDLPEFQESFTQEES